jgi:hypothetical protein
VNKAWRFYFTIAQDTYRIEDITPPNRERGMPRAPHGLAVGGKWPKTETRQTMFAQVTASRSGRTIYFNGRALKAIRGADIAGNYIDLRRGMNTGLSGIKKRGSNRHWLARAK